LRRRFPSVGTVFVSRPRLDPLALLRLGRASISDLVVVRLDDLQDDLKRAVRRSYSRTTGSMVIRALPSDVPRPERDVVRAAMDGAILGWRADDLAGHVGWTRAHLSVRLKDVGLPSAGHLLLWAKLLHASRWLVEPGRSAQSVSRQLEYSSGAALRRALHNYLGVTPTQLCESGGFPFVLRAFLDVCDLGDSVRDRRSVA
jgi:AraC-like DNA-binding protein